MSSPLAGFNAVFFARADYQYVDQANAGVYQRCVSTGLYQ